MLYPAELRAHQCFQSLSQEPKFLGTGQAPKVIVEKYFRQLRLPELARRSYPRKTPPAEDIGQASRSRQSPLQSPQTSERKLSILRQSAPSIDVRSWSWSGPDRVM